LASADFAAMVRRNFGGMFSPFLLPTNIPLLNTTPRIFYEVYGLRVRASDFMFYGLMIGVARFEMIELSLIVIAIITSFVICVFVCPFYSKQIRPLPVAFVALLAMLFFDGQIFQSFVRHQKWKLICP